MTRKEFRQELTKIREERLQSFLEARKKEIRRNILPHNESKKEFLKPLIEFNREERLRWLIAQRRKNNISKDKPIIHANHVKKES